MEDKMPTEPITVETAMKESVSVFEGHPAEGEIETKPEEKEEPEKKPEEKLEKPAFEYVSQEAAEKGVKDAKTLMHEKADEAKREREKAEDLQKQLNDALVKITESTEKSEAVVPTSTDKMKTLLDQVNALDPEDEDYHSKVAAIWGSREDEIQSNIDAKVKEALDSYDKNVKEEKSKVDSELSAQKKIVSDAEVAGTEVGLDMKKGSSDSELFWAFADKAPEGTIEDQIKWTVDKVKGIKAAYVAPSVEEKALEAAKKAKATQEQNAVLERGGHKPAEKVVPETPLGLGEAFTQIQRRI